MLTVRRLCFAPALGLIFAVAVTATTSAPRQSLLVEPIVLAQQLEDPNLVLLHVGNKAEYDAGHIPGARYVAFGETDRSLDVSDHSGAGLMLEMPTREVLRSRIEALGISTASRVVVIFGGNWVSPATRVLFALDHAGVGNVALLDGGLAAWVAAGLPLSAKVPEVSPGDLSGTVERPTVVDARFVREHLGRPGFVVIDARVAGFYSGAEVGGAHAAPHKKGHIRGARSVPYTAVTSTDLRLRKQTELEELFRQAGVEPGDTVIGYCHIGQQATAMLFAARLLGHPVRLYDGSFEEWSRLDGAVEGPQAAGNGGS